MIKNIINFITDTFKRFFKPSPTYFKILQWISMIVAFVTGVPALLAQYHISLGPVLSKWENSAVAIASIVAYVIAKLTVKDQTALQIQDKHTP